MFVQDEVPVEASFAVACDRLGKLGSWFANASGDAYDGGLTTLARIGPIGPAPGLSKLVQIRFQHLTPRPDRAGLALRWEVRGPGGGLFPVLDADLTLIPADEDGAVLGLAGTYRPPLGGLGAELDRLILHRVAEATVRQFLVRTAEALGRPPASTD